MDDIDTTARAGVSVLVFQQDCPEQRPEVLLGLRKGAGGAGTWGPPGGRIAPGEHPRKTASRELREETGIVLGPSLLTPWTPRPVTSTIVDGTGWVTLFYHAVYRRGGADVDLREPQKCAEWRFFAVSNLPSRLFAPMLALCHSGFSVDECQRVFWRLQQSCP